MDFLEQLLQRSGVMSAVRWGDITCCRAPGSDSQKFSSLQRNAKKSGSKPVLGLSVILFYRHIPICSCLTLRQ